MKVMMIKNSRMVLSVWLVAILTLPSACGSADLVSQKKSSKQPSQVEFKPEIASYKLSLEDEEKVLEVQFAQEQLGKLKLHLVKEKTCEKCLAQVEIVSDEKSQPSQFNTSNKVYLSEYKDTLDGFDFVISNNIKVEKQ